MTFDFPRSVKKADPQIIRMMFSTAVLVVLGIAGCSGLQQTPEPEKQVASPQAVTTVSADVNEKSSPTAGATSEPKVPTRLVVWLADEFNPQNANLAESLMKNQLQDLLIKNPEIVVDLRVKGEDQAHSILNILELTNRHAPEALPDVILIRAEDARAARRRGLLPANGIFNTILQEGDWYPYAKQLSDSKIVGDCIPMAGDATVIFADSNLRISQPQKWVDIERRKSSLGFPAVDPTQMFFKMLMNMNDAQIVNENGKYQISPDGLEATLRLILSAIDREILNADLLEYSSERNVWIDFGKEKFDWAALQISHYLKDLDANVQTLNFVNNEGLPILPATGWLWCVLATEPEKQTLAMTYVRWMTDPKFQMEWTPSAGYLPVRLSSIAGWNDQPSVSQIVASLSEKAQVFQDFGIAPEIENILHAIMPSIFAGEQDALGFTELINSQVQLINDAP